MKRIVTLALALALVMAWAAAASAEVVVKAKGEFTVNANLVNNFNLDRNGANTDAYDDFAVYERARIDFRFVANENLEGIFYMEYGTSHWGSPGVFDINTSGRTPGIKVKRAYVSFRWPDTDVLFNLGYQNVALPSAYEGGWVLNNDAAAAVVSTPITDMFSVTAGYVRAFDQAASKGAGENNDVDASANQRRKSEEVDLGFLAVPITPEGVDFTPWFLYGYAGSNATTSPSFDLANGLLTPNSTGFGGEGANMYWAGAALTMDMFDPFVVMLDFAWGQKTSPVKQLRREGWFMDLAVQYAGLDFMTPEFVFAYGSGENDKWDDGSERMPVLSNDGSWAVGSYFFGGSELLEGDMADVSNVGFWTVGLQLKDITFIDKLSHAFNVLYVRGTNDHKLLKENPGRAATMVGFDNGITYGRTLFDKDSLWEVDLNHRYQIYEELAAIVELSWVYADFDEDTWNKVDASYGGLQQSWKLALGAVYEF
ncbi:MAG: outer membrane homotrimeric porin [Desulfovibrionaceae bacterium]